MRGRKVYPIRTSLIRIKVICIGTRSNVDTPKEVRTVYTHSSQSLLNATKRQKSILSNGTNITLPVVGMLMLCNDDSCIICLNGVSLVIIFYCYNCNIY